MKHPLRSLALSAALDLRSRPRRRHRLEEGRHRPRQDRHRQRRGASLRTAAIRSACHAGRRRRSSPPWRSADGSPSRPMHGEAMVMGDLVLLDSEITPVMTKLLDSGLEITAIHNHILRASPATFYMHVAGHGDPEKMAAAIRAALSSASKTPFDPPATTGGRGASRSISTPRRLDEAMDAKGTVNGGVYQFGIPRREPATEGGMQVNAALGGANAINFQPTGGGKAAITGDFLVTGDEVNPADPGAARRRHRGDGDPQPHARRAAADVLHPLLGQRRRAETGARTFAPRSTRRRSRRTDARSDLDLGAGTKSAATIPPRAA